MNKVCCEYHDKLWLIDEQLEDCGMAGKGDTQVCCESCPELDWYRQNQPTRTVEILASPPHKVKKEETNE